MPDKMSSEELKTAMEEMGERALIASRFLATATTELKNECLLAMADALEKETDILREANEKDLKAGEANGLTSAMLDRLRLTNERIKATAEGLRVAASLEDPVGRVISSALRPNGIKIDKVSVPIGVVGIIYESRPNVTVDAAGLCLKAGNAVILRGGSEAINSNLALARCLDRAAVSAGIPEGAAQLIPWTDREAVSILLKMDEYVDLIIPRGGEGLIRAVVEQSTIPVIKHYKGVCHAYVDAEYDMDMALAIVENAKCQRPGVCNAIESLLIHRDAAKEFAPAIAKRLRKRGVELRGNDEFRKFVPSAKPALEADWSEEYLDLILAVAVIPSIDDAIEHINRYGSGHSDAIISSNSDNAEKFLAAVDSAAVYLNASTRFTDGAEFGMGAEIGISTDKLHARGPMALPELRTYKYVVTGNGQIRN